MAKVMNEDEQVTAKLDAKGRSAIVKAIGDAAASLGGNGNIVTHVCEVARQYAKGDALSDADQKSIMRSAAQLPSIKGQPNPRTRANILSRWSTVLQTYNLIPEADKQLRASVGAVNWHAVMMLATKLKRDPNTKKAASAVAKSIKTTGKAAVGPKNAKAAKAALAMMIKRAVKLDHLPAQLVKALNAFADKHSLND